MTLSGINATFFQLHKDYDAEHKLKNSLVVAAMTQALKDATPVDTGRARDGWHAEYIGDVYNIRNPVEYIDKLNEGSSKQAPAHFIENTVLLFANPLGVIVDHE